MDSLRVTGSAGGQKARGPYGRAEAPDLSERLITGPPYRGSRAPRPRHVRPRGSPQVNAPGPPVRFCPRVAGFPALLARVLYPWPPSPLPPAIPAAQLARPAPRSSPGAALSRGRTRRRRGRTAGGRDLGCITWSRRAGAAQAGTEAGGRGRSRGDGARSHHGQGEGSLPPPPSREGGSGLSSEEKCPAAWVTVSLLTWYSSTAGLNEYL